MVEVSAKRQLLGFLREMAQVYPKNINIPLGLKFQPSPEAPLEVEYMTIRGPFNRQRSQIAQQIRTIRNKQARGIDPSTIEKEFSSWCADFRIKSRVLSQIIPYAEY